MKIISCHIENYGKFTKKDFYFDSDIASFNWENGAGKTTLASFIKAMFYGIPSVKANTKSFEDRQHFYPFDKGSFGGSIVFELNGTEFKIERFFDKKSSVKDEVKVYKNGGLTDELGDDIGKSVFGIDKESFEKTVFFNAEDIEIYTPAGIEAKIQNSDEGSTAKKLLEEEIKKLQPQRGKNGLIPNQQELVRTLREEAYRLESIQERTQTLYERREQIKEEIKEKEEEIKKSLVLESKLEEYVVPANKEREFAALSDMFITGVPQKSDFERINKCFDEFKELDEKDSQLKEQQQQILNKAKMNKLLLTVEAFLIITAAVLLGVGQIIGAVVTVGMAGILAVYLCVSAKKLKQAEVLQQERRKLTLRYEFCLQEIIEFVRAYKTNYNESDLKREVEIIREAAEKYLREKEEHQRIELRRSEIKSEMGMKNADSIQSEREMARLKQEMANLERQIYRDEAEMEDLADRQNQLEEAEELLTKYKESLFVFEAALNALQEAENNIKNKYAAPIKARFEKYSEIAEEVIGEKIIIDDEFNVYFEIMGQQKSYKHLSCGQKAVLAFCFRMALADSMYGEEKPFVILDDPFISLDKDNMEKISKAVRMASKDRQIIYFCCHDSRNVIKST
ncbi:MAG: hypothetical protein E7387_03285 [Ruminococcaceae bacterium]|nr:hypothetical protein [Oscillospiraceae bacterium]